MTTQPKNELERLTREALMIRYTETMDAVTAEQQVDSRVAIMGADGHHAGAAWMSWTATTCHVLTALRPRLDPAGQAVVDAILGEAA